MVKNLGAVFLGICIAGCGDSGSDNGLSESYPSDLVITSPFATGSAVEGLTKLTSRFQQISEEPLSPPDYVEKEQEIQNRIQGSSIADCKFNLALFRPKVDVTCYGPQLDFMNHVDGDDASWPDQNMNGSPDLPSGDVGIWESTEASTNEPCVVAKINSIVSEAQAYIQTSQDLLASMLCLAKVKGLDTLPALGASSDLTNVFADIRSDALPIDAENALIERLDDIDGRPQYHSRVTAKIGEGTSFGAVSVSTDLYHLPTSTDNATYKGRLTFTFSGAGYATPGGGCSANSELIGGSIVYEKSASGINYQFKRAKYCEEAQAEPFDSSNDLDASNKYNATTNPGGWASDFTDFRGNFNPDTLVGTYSAAWQAGALDSNTRAFLAQIESADQTYNGCGYYGFGPDVEDTNVGNISGMICNWAGPGNSHTPLTQKVQRQCVDFNRTTKVWESDAALLNISYAPTNDCEINNETSTHDGGGVASFDGETVIPNNLLDLSEMPLSPPTPPSGI
ncbi:MAG: hypothetical protein KDD48_01680 [Bdellovibrionales bacterium]|nr:hypothetical protein [Bdellovibrionales bacterium]